ncbi:hypothetical protein SBA4_6670006 [Candidatus Sulfopaludibacter sp. SbA4]|nr:hypothetical protein SBA4_6670006 [Candidatus Sulfopaludibacter sp. SbA4]
MTGPATQGGIEKQRFPAVNLRLSSGALRHQQGNPNHHKSSFGGKTISDFQDLKSALSITPYGGRKQ